MQHQQTALCSFQIWGKDEFGSWHIWQAALDPWCWGRRLNLESSCLDLCRVSTQMDVLLLFLLWISVRPFHPALLIVIPPHTECFLPSGCRYICIKWCLAWSNKHIPLKKHLILIFIFCNSPSTLLSNPNFNEASGKTHLEFCAQLKRQFLFFLISLSCVISMKNLKNMIWNSARNLLKG